MIDDIPKYFFGSDDQTGHFPNGKFEIHLREFKQPFEKMWHAESLRVWITGLAEERIPIHSVRGRRECKRAIARSGRGLFGIVRIGCIEGG